MITSPESRDRRPRVDWAFVAIAVVGGLVMAVVSKNDLAWTSWLRQNTWDGMASWMDATMFEGESFGGGDISLVFVIAAIVCYTLANHFPALNKRLTAWRPYAGLVIAMGLLYQLGFVHSLKYLIGRARPHHVLNGGLDYSSWFEFGSFYITQGTYSGSCPSGHTATAFMLVIPAYILVADHRHRATMRAVGMVLGIAAFSFCALMAASRCMTNSHWITDCTFSIVGGMVMLHVLYHYVLRVPRQVDYYRLHTSHPNTPVSWELRLASLLLLLVVGMLCVGFSLRSFWEQQVPWLALLAIPGVGFVLASIHWTRQLRRVVFSTYDAAESKQALEQAA